jgi:acetyltransferase-like isoleucine patch superfamily enzyme
MLVKKTKIPFIAVATVGILPSFLKILFYKAKGYKIGKNVSIGIGSVIIGKDVVLLEHSKIGHFTIIRAEDILIERYATIGSFSFIDSSSIRIGEDARINEQVIVGGMKTPESRLDLGKRTIIMEYSFINTTKPVIIGDDSGIGGHCLLFTHGSWLNQLEGFPVTFAPIKIGKNVWLPWRVFIMPGVELGDKVVVGANSLISKNVESNSLVAGSPAKVIKENYPKPISKEQKLLYFKSYIDDFISHLNHNDIKVSMNENSQNISLTGIANYSKFRLESYFEEINDIPDFNEDSLIVMNISEEFNTLPKSTEENIMYIDILNKKRIGSSNVGEEFVKFISRYGLRFSRKD